jgi:hypothetical protein
VLRDSQEHVVAAAPAGWPTAQIPETQLAPDTLLPADESRLRFGEKGLRLPAGGGRLSVRGNLGSMSIDVWEDDTRGFDVSEGRTLTIAALILGLELARRQAK